MSTLHVKHELSGEASILTDGTRDWLKHDFPIPVGVWRAHAAEVSGIISSHGEMIPSSEVIVVGDVVLHPDDPFDKGDVKMGSFAHLHTHSEYSPLDGLSKIDELIAEAQRDGQSHLAITDHGVCAGHLELFQKAPKAGITPVFGIEANFTDDATSLMEDGRRDPDTRYAYKHLVLLAKNNVGLHNLWRASTMAARPERYYGRSRMDWKVLEDTAEGVIASSACLRGPLSDMILSGDEEEARALIYRFKKIYGDDFWLEIHVNQLPDQLKINHALVELGQSTSTGLIAVGDSHYPCAEHADAHSIWIAAQTDKDLQDEADLFAGNEQYHLHSESDVREALSYLPDSVADEAIRNTMVVARQCDASIQSSPSTPVYHRYEQPDEELQGADLDAKVLDSLCRKAMPERFPDEVWEDDELSRQYHERYEMEMETLRSKGFCGYMLINWDLANEVRRLGILMGPGRGSAAGCLVSYLLGVTQVDPIEADLLFERFISPGRTELPDIDSDYPQSKRSIILDYLVQRWNPEHVVRVGTITRLRNKGVFKDVARVLKGSEYEVDFADSKAISDIIDAAESGTAGLGLSWEKLWDEAGDALEPYKESYPVLFKYAELLVGRLRSYGKHPAGVVIDPSKPIIDSVPMRQGEDNYPVTEWPMEVLDALGLVKFDVLTLRTLDTIQECMDLIASDERYAGRVPHPHTWREEYKDPQVWDMICSGDTLGIFQLETPACSGLNDRIRPRSIADLCAILTLVRPGPMNSGLTDAYIRRRDGEEAVSFAHPLLANVLHKTYGTMIYQEDIMNTTKVIAGYDSAEAENVRKILGKKKVDKIAAEGEKFLRMAAERGIDKGVAERMFAQMEEFAKYSFNKSHSWAYAMVAYWTAWFKCHFPAHFIVACLSTADKERFPEYVAYARRRGYRIDLPDINDSAVSFTISPDDMGIMYGLSSVKDLGQAAAAAAISTRPYSSLSDMIDRRDTQKFNWGAIKKLASIGALDSLAPSHHRREIEDFVEQMSTGKLEQCVHLVKGTVPSDGPDLCCGFDWSSEPVEIGKSGKPKKQKPPPKRCTKACRQYVPEPAVEWHELPEYTPEEIRAREMETLGLYVSSTPFDNFDVDDPGLSGMDKLQAGETDSKHRVLAEIISVRTQNDRNGRRMGFVKLMVPDGEFSAVIFSSSWRKMKSLIEPGRMGVFGVIKSDRGYQVDQMIPIRSQREEVVV